MSGIGLLNEKSVHASSKEWYAQPEDQFEVAVDGFVIDIVRDDLLLEIQIGNLASIKSKLTSLARSHRIRLIYPVALGKNIMRTLQSLIRHTLLFSFLLLLGCTRADSSDSRTNIVLIMTDDQGYGDFGFTGNPVIQTPHLDSMARGGVQMTTFYVSPVCAPTRASLLTGRYNYRTRVVDTYVSRAMMDAEEVTIAEVLQSKDYSTGIFGKWHLGDNYPMRPQDQGFDEVLVHRGGGIGQPSDPVGAEGKYTDPILLHNGELIQTQGFCTDVYFDYALEWIEERHESGEPFFAYIPTNAPHDPFHDVPEDLLAEYRRMDLSDDQFPQYRGHPLPSRDDLDIRARTYAMITNIDDNIGRLFDSLETLDLIDNTIVVFLTDNGSSGRRYIGGFRGGKSSVYEGGIRTPLLLHWPPRLKAGFMSDRVTAHIDVMPTLLDMLNIEPPEAVQLDGRSFFDLATGESTEWPARSLVIQTHRGEVPVRYHHFMIRDDRWKLVHHSGFGREKFEGELNLELYDLLADPYEEFDVAAEFPEVVARLRDEYDRWFDDVSSTRPDNYGKMRIHVGTHHESPTVLTHQDWQQINRFSWGSAEAIGFWDIEVTADDSYDILVRFPKAVSGGLVTLSVDSVSQTGTAPSGSSQFLFEDVPLQTGPARLMATVDDGTLTAGAWQIEIQR
ncbi:MAG: arylsulfatase [Gemmatimonadota bacterium]|nr:MAG: arylsulfatase [Gemmatimonadota bacterium]